VVRLRTLLLEAVLRETVLRGRRRRRRQKMKRVSESGGNKKGRWERPGIFG
jgi:hypothetical protein